MLAVKLGFVPLQSPSIKLIKHKGIKEEAETDLFSIKRQLMSLAALVLFYTIRFCMSDVLYTLTVISVGDTADGLR
jgi:hypothetical protein